MYDLLELPKRVVPATEEFIGQKLPLSEMPEFFSFQSAEVRYGLQALLTWSVAAGGKETAGVLFKGVNGNTRFRDLTIGSEVGVNILTEDFSRLSPDEARIKLEEISKGDVFSQFVDRRFVLISEQYPDDDRNIKGAILEKGTKIYGNIHVHPSGTPPNGHDLAHLLFGDSEPIVGVICGDTHYVMVASKEMSHLEIEQTDHGEGKLSNTLRDYGETIDSETRLLVATTVNSKDEAARISLVKHCKMKGVALYEGSLTKNEYRRIT